MKTKLLIAAAFVMGCTTCFFVGKYTNPPAQTVTIEPTAVVGDCIPSVEIRSGGYKLINPLLECDNYRPSALKSVEQLQTSVKGYVAESVARGKVDLVSVYFRDLNNGPWIGVNEEESYSPASLLKVPILISVLKKAETEPDYLKQKITFVQPFDRNPVPNIVDKNQIKKGHTYTVQQLLDYMIMYSDNEAKQLLLNNLGDAYVINVMGEVGLNIHANLNSDYVSVKDYAHFFRMLYNGTYLNRDMSEKALQILCKTDYNDGLMAGVPKQTVVAHKFGERAFNNSDIKQLHDCGIVYVNNSPYLLCVMTRGKELKEMAKVIAGVSSVVYKHINTVAKPA